MQFKKIFDIGINKATDRLEARYIRYTNIFTLMLLASAVLSCLGLFIAKGLVLITISVSSLILLYGLILLLTSLGYYYLSRILLAFLTPTLLMALSYFSKAYDPDMISGYTYFDTRTMLLAVLVIPIAVFPVKRKTLLYLATFLPGIFIIGYDPLHSLMGISYWDVLGEPEIGYGVSGLYYSIAYIFLVTGFLIFKFKNEKLITENINLVKGLKSSNKQLKDASDTIHEQSLALIQSNKELSELVNQRTAELKSSNEELIKHNLELQQFSNTISHNLRGPVANLLGLAQLFELDKNERSLAEVIKHIKSSAASLDEVLKDLGKIIDIRNHLFQIKENVKFSDEFEKTRSMLSDQIKACNAQISTDFEYDTLYCIRSYIDSILYNLLSNALKYRDTTRPLEIKVSSRLVDDIITLELEDNGIGIDIEKYGNKVFGMYKRFHDHVDGKGLGLFLTKQQVETLGGKIEVASHPGEGAKFIMSCPKPPESIISEQIFYESDAVTIWFDAVNFISTLVWKRKPSSEEYRDGLTRNLEIFRTYKCEGCLADVRLLGNVSKEDMGWFVNNILSDAPEIGLKKFIIVHDSDDGKGDAYFEEMRKAVEAHNIFFDHDSFTMNEAKHIIRNAITP